MGPVPQHKPVDDVVKILARDGVRGGPVDPLYFLPEVIALVAPKLASMARGEPEMKAISTEAPKHPILEIILSLLEEEEEDDASFETGPLDHSSHADVHQMIETGNQSLLAGNQQNEKMSLTCDQALARFLIFVSQHVRESFYIKATKFVLLYRDCYRRVNEVLDDNQSPSKPDKDLTDEDLRFVTPAEHLPIICNSFMIPYLGSFKN